MYQIIEKSHKIATSNVVILEDNDTIRETIVLKFHDCGYSAVGISHINELTPEMIYAGKLFILDMDMRSREEAENGLIERRREGLDACKKIKEKNSDAFVVCYSSKLGSADKKYFDFSYRKTLEIRLDCEIIYSEFEKFLKEKIELIEQKRKDLEALLRNPDCVDTNYAAYQKYQADQQWLQKNLNYFVAFVDGELIDDRDKHDYKLVQRLRDNKDYDNKRQLVLKVQDVGYDDSMEEPSSWWMDSIEL